MSRHPSPHLAVVAAALFAGCGDNKTITQQPDGGTPDAGPVDVPLERAHAGGSPSAIVVVGTRAYIGVGARLAIWNIETNPPTLVGESHELGGVVGAVAVAGDRAYVAERVDTDSEIHVIDISNPAQPTDLGSFSVAPTPDGWSFITDLDARDGVLYVADQEQGIVELSLANPDVPAIVRLGGSAGVSKMFFSGTRLYYTAQGFIGGASLGALDTSSELADLGSAPLGNVQGVAAAGDLVIGAGPDGIYVQDFTDPANPIERFHAGAEEMGPFSRAITAHGTQAYVPAEDGLYILDLTTPTAITVTGPHAIESVGANAAVATADTIAYVTDRGRLVVLGAATASQPELARKADVTLCAMCLGVSTHEDLLYVADVVGGVRTASLATLEAKGRSPALPVVTEAGLQFVYEDVFVAGTRAFVSDWLFGMRIYDTSNPAAPALIGSHDSPGAPSSVTVDGARAYLTEGSDGGGLHIIDVANPAAPVALGSISTSKALAVQVRGTTAFLADDTIFEPGGLRILDVTNPAAITQIGIYDEDCTRTQDVALAGNIAIAACGGDGFHFVDISNPTAPTRIAVVPPPDEASAAFSVASYAGHAVLGHNRGVIVTTLGPNPQVIASFATASPVRSLTVPTPGRIVACAGVGGVYQWAVTE